MAEKKMRRRITVSVLIMVMLCAGHREILAQDMPVAGGEKLLPERCTTCHDLKRVEKHYGKYDQSQWEKVVERMIKRGAQLNAAERVSVIDYLRAQETARKQ